MDAYLLILRIIHILTSVFWAGVAFMLVLFLLPAIKNAGEAGKTFMQQLTKTNNYLLVMNINALVALFSGILIYWYISNGMSISWMNSGQGISITTGGVSAIIAYLVGFFVQRPTGTKMAEIGRELSKKGGPPDQNTITHIGKLQKRMNLAAKWIAFLLLISVITMAIARNL